MRENSSSSVHQLNTLESNTHRAPITSLPWTNLPVTLDPLSRSIVEGDGSDENATKASPDADMISTAIGVVIAAAAVIWRVSSCHSKHKKSAYRVPMGVLRAFGWYWTRQETKSQSVRLLSGHLANIRPRNGWLQKWTPKIAFSAAQQLARFQSHVQCTGGDN